MKGVFQICKCFTFVGKREIQYKIESKETTIKFRMRTPIIQSCCSSSRTGHSACLNTLRQSRLLHHHKTYKHLLGSRTQYYIFHKFYRIKFWKRNLLKAGDTLSSRHVSSRHVRRHTPISSFHVISCELLAPGSRGDNIPSVSVSVWSPT